MSTKVLPENSSVSRGPKGSGTVVSANLESHPNILEAIRLAAKADDREVSNWLRRRLVALHEAGDLIPKPEQKELKLKTGD